MKPRVAFQVPNTLTGEGNSASTSPSRAWTTSRRRPSRARSRPLNKLLQARQQLSNLITYMDGKTGAEELIAKALKDPALLQALAVGAQTPRTVKPPKPDRTSEGRPMAAIRNKAPKPRLSAVAAASAEFGGRPAQKAVQPARPISKREVESAVRTLAQQALASTQLISDESSSHRGDDRRDRQEAD